MRKSMDFLPVRFICCQISDFCLASSDDNLFAVIPLEMLQDGSFRPVLVLALAALVDYVSSLLKLVFFDVHLNLDLGVPLPVVHQKGLGLHELLVADLAYVGIDAKMQHGVLAPITDQIIRGLAARVLANVRLVLEMPHDVHPYFLDRAKDLPAKLASGTTVGAVAPHYMDTAPVLAVEHQRTVLALEQQLLRVTEPVLDVLVHVRLRLVAHRTGENLLLSQIRSDQILVLVAVVLADDLFADALEAQVAHSVIRPMDHVLHARFLDLLGRVRLEVRNQLVEARKLVGRTNVAKILRVLTDVSALVRQVVGVAVEAQLARLAPVELAVVLVVRPLGQQALFAAGRLLLGEVPREVRTQLHGVDEGVARFARHRFLRQHGGASLAVDAQLVAGGKCAAAVFAQLQVGALLQLLVKTKQLVRVENGVAAVAEKVLQVHVVLLQGVHVQLQEVQVLVLA